MKVENSVMPNQTQIAGFSEPGPEPIYMVNLLKFKEKAEYDDGRPTTLSGQEAYHIYGTAVAELLKEFGGALLFSADVHRLMIGDVEKLWDEVGIATYPSRQAMLDMMRSTRMQEISIHRSAGLEGQLNIETGGAAGDLLARVAG